MCPPHSQYVSPRQSCPLSPLLPFGTFIRDGEDAVQVGLSGALFALSHYQPHDFLPLSALGATLALVVIRAKGNLVAPTVTHITYNLALVLALNGA